MKKFLVQIKEVTIRRYDLEVEAEDWEEAERKGQEFAYNNSSDDWSEDYDLTVRSEEHTSELQSH